MRVFLLLFLCLTSFGAETRQERAKRVVDEALDALGGERFLSMRDRVESGRAYSFYRDEISGLSRAKIYTKYLEQTESSEPGALGLSERQVLGEEEDVAVLITAGKAYEITFRGARPLPDDVLDRLTLNRLHNIFYILRMRLGEAGMFLYSKGSDVLANQPVEVVDITDSENRTVTVYFHRTTKLPVRQVYYRRDPETRARIEEVTEFGKYRDVGGGVMWPLTILQRRDGERSSEIYSETVTINQDLPDSLFTLPSDMKILPPAD